ncbi:MAG: YeeE/YedE family protein [Myxococcales bacterium]|nr:YeeE/YedE family protein [Myxococcales bacterium]
MNSAVMRNVVVFVSGVIFAVGLGLSGMTQPDKVKGFLDFFGKWDPTLLAVIGSATGLNLILFRFILKRPAPILEAKFSLPTKKDIDRPLVVGAVLFGIGWGVGGFCPGPALTSLASGTFTAVLFVVSMAAGSLGYLFFEKAQAAKPAPSTDTANASGSIEAAKKAA